MSTMWLASGAHVDSISDLPGELVAGAERIAAR